MLNYVSFFFLKIVFPIGFALMVSLLQTSTGHCQKPARIILLETMPVPVVLEHTRWFVTQLNEMGYQNGSNMELVILKANGDRSRAHSILKNAIAEGSPDIVVTNATLASQAAQEVLKETDIPILFMTVSDPVGAGLIREIGLPTGTNITGKVHMISRETRINMILSLIGKSHTKKPIRIGFIHSSYPSAVGDIRELKAAVSNQSDIIFLSEMVPYRKIPEGLPAMLKEVAERIDKIKAKIDFWWEPSGPIGEVEEYTKLLQEKSSKPIVMGTKLQSVKLGALLHLTPDIETSGRETALLADAILKGKNPGDIPPAPPTSFTMGINLSTALKHGIIIPPDMIQLAGKNVFR